MTVKGRSITGVVIISLIAVTTLVMAAFGAVNYYRERNARTEELKAEIKIISNQLSQGLALPLWSCNFEGVAKIAESVMENRDVYAVVVREPGRVIARTRDSNWGIVATDKDIPTNGLIYEKRKIYHSDEFVGELWVYLSPRFMEKALQRSILILAIEILVLNICLVTILFLINMKTVLTPLKAIENYAVKMSGAGGMEEAYIKGEGFPRELENLRLSIEEMVGQIKGRYNDLERSQAALREAEAKYRGIFENSVDGIFQSAPDGRILDLNPAHARIHGYASPREMQASIRNIGEQLYVNPEARAELQRLLAEQGVVEAYEIQMYKKNGDRIWISVNVRAVKDEKGTILYHEGTSEDITKRKMAEEELIKYKEHLEELVAERTAKLTVINEQLQKEIQEREQAEKALRESENNLKIILHSMRVGIAMVDAETHTIIDVNNEAAGMIGDSKDRIIGSTCHNFICPAEEGQCPITDLRQPADNSERELLTVKGVKTPILKTVVPVMLGGRKVLIESFVDITVQKKIEEERLKLKKLESTGILAGGIAHDFNNLLGAILGNISLAQKYLDPEGDAFPLLKDAERISLRASDLTKQFITFSKGGEPLKKEMIIKDQVINTVSLSLSGSNVRCGFDIDEAVWPVKVDEGQIREVISNIVLNACESMPGGGVLNVSMKNVTVADQEVPSLKKGNYIKISIEDHGKGISDENLSKIFDPYFSTKAPGNQKGMGLGLSVCYSVIKNHDGLIAVESKIGKGTTFHIYLPSSRIETPSKGITDGGASSRKAKILVMDDEEMIRDIAGKMLRYMGYEVVLTKDGVEAIRLYKAAKESSQPFDVVMMDLTIPGGMGGGEAVKELLALDPEAVVIASSGHSLDPVMSDFGRYGFRSVIAKPYNVTKIKEVLSMFIKNG